MVGQTFRPMDPVSQRMMGVADCDEYALAATRLFAAPRPASVLRRRGAAGRRRPVDPERELAGRRRVDRRDHLAADVEMIMLATEALAAVGIEGVSVDTLCQHWCPWFAIISGWRRRPAALRDARSQRRQPSGVIGRRRGPLLTELMLATGGADPRGARIAGDGADRTHWPCFTLRTAKPDLAVTVDPVENRGFEYYIGTCFSLFRAGVRGELGAAAATSSPATRPSPPLASRFTWKPSGAPCRRPPAPCC